MGVSLNDVGVESGEVVDNTTRVRAALYIWNAKAEKIQDIEDHTKTTVLNQENNILIQDFFTLQQEILSMCKTL